MTVLFAEALDQHWLEVGRPDQSAWAATCSCGHWQYDFHGPPGLKLGDHFAPFSEHVAVALRTALRERGVHLVTVESLAKAAQNHETSGIHGPLHCSLACGASLFAALGDVADEAALSPEPKP